MLQLFLLAKFNDILDIPFTTNAIADNVDIAQKDIRGIPNTIIKPTRKFIPTENILQPQKWKLFFIWLTKAVPAMLSNKKYTPIRAVSHSKFIFGTNNSSIPMVAIYKPKNISNKT